jgi:hypothetical protein
MRELRKNQKLLYLLHESEDGDLFFTVTCGGVGMYNVKIKLTVEELDSFQDEGDQFLDSLAREIQKNSRAFESRAI